MFKFNKKAKVSSDVGDLGVNHQELSAIMDRYDVVVKTFPDIIYEINDQGYFVFLSEGVQLFGYTSEELIGKHFKEILHPEDFARVSRENVLPTYSGKVTGNDGSPGLFDERRTKDRITKGLEVRVVVKGESDEEEYRCCEVYSSGKWSREVSSKNKKFLGSIGVMRDVTERKQIELQRVERIKELRCFHEFSQLVDKSKDNFDAMLKGLADLLPSAYQYPQKTYARIIFKDNEFKSQNFKQTPYKQTANISIFGDNCGIIEVYCEETQSNKGQGVFLKEEQQLLSSMVERLGKIAGRLEADEFLRRSEEGLALIVNNSLDGMVIVDNNGAVKLINPVALRLLDREKEDLLGKLFPFTVSEGEKAEEQIIHGGQNIISVEMHAVGIEWQGDNAKLVSIRDNTVEKEKDKVKNEFISMVSHELRTPLTAIRESVSQILDGIQGSISEKQRSFLSLCLRNTDHLGKIVDNLLDVAKVEAGKLELQRENTDIVGLIDVIAASFVPSAQKKGLGVRVFSPDGLIETYVDKDKIMEVFNNVINNAIKFTEKGDIEIKVVDGEEYVTCSIADKGKGISPEDLPYIFDKFRQFGKHSQSGQKGTGLGMAISKSIVKLHGGRMQVASTLGEGTTFTFTLPKYNVKLVLQDSIKYIVNLLKETYEELVVFIVRIDNLSEAEKVFGEEKVQQWLFKILDAVTGVANEGELVDKGAGNEIIILAGLSRQTVSAMKLKFRQAVKEVISEINSEFELNFLWGQALYPQEGRNIEQLLSKAYTNLTKEKEQRLAKRILILDDEPKVAKALESTLQALGYKNVILASNGEDALAKAQVGEVDLMILDMKMPDISGYEVVGRLKEDNRTKDLPILIMSGYTVEIEKIEEHMKEKAICTLTKPFDIEQVKKLVYLML
ncbi:MAG: response regulator [Candidatus Omnitrophica bacterium]|nr:response regulator [Candidatus Omnitrophota bacterium]